jgi:hypothetical protein
MKSRRNLVLAIMRPALFSWLAACSSSGTMMDKSMYSGMHSTNDSKMMSKSMDSGMDSTKDSKAMDSGMDNAMASKMTGMFTGSDGHHAAGYQHQTERCCGSPLF